MTGTTNPAKVKPLKVNGDMVICGTKTVRTYRRIAFEKNEKSPRVTIFKGREKMFRIGLKTLNKIERIRPAMTKVLIPPPIFTPAKSSEIIKSEIALKTVSRIIVFIKRA